MYLIVLNIELVDEALQEPVFVNVLPPSEANGAVPPMTRLTLYDVLTSDMPSSSSFSFSNTAAVFLHAAAHA